MGFFEVAYRCPHGYVSQLSVPNTLSYEARAWLMRRILPPRSGEFSWEMGFAGPMYRGKTEIGAPDWEPTDSFVWGPKIKYSDFVGVWGHEGGLGYDDAHELFGYSRKPIEWAVIEDRSGALIDTGWKTWTHRLQWKAYGKFETAGPRYDCLLGWTNRMNKPQGFPWCIPYVGYGDDDYEVSWWHRNEFGVNCASCAAYGSFARVSHIPVGACFVTISNGLEDRLFAAAKFIAPTFWRPGGMIACRYVGRFGSPVDRTYGYMASDYWAKVVAKSIAGQPTGEPSTPWKVALVKIPGDVDFGPTTRLKSDWIVLNPATAGNWTVVDYVPDDPETSADEEVLPKAYSDFVEFTNNTDEIVKYTGVLVLNNSLSNWLFGKVWSVRDASPGTIYPGDTLRVYLHEFTIEEVAE